MARRRGLPAGLEFFPTQPWAGRALCHHVLPFALREIRSDTRLDGLHLWEPACGSGELAEALAESFGTVWASDIHDYGYGHVADFTAQDSLLSGHGWAPPRLPDFIGTNPPFSKAGEFLAIAREIAVVGVCLLVRLQWLESLDRYQSIFRRDPPRVVAIFSERLPLVEGRCDARASSATAYAWFVWLDAPARESRLFWIPPCRRELERPGDYDERPGWLPRPEADSAEGLDLGPAGQANPGRGLEE